MRERENSERAAKRQRARLPSDGNPQGVVEDQLDLRRSLLGGREHGGAKTRRRGREDKGRDQV